MSKLRNKDTPALLANKPLYRISAFVGLDIEPDVIFQYEKILIHYCEFCLRSGQLEILEIILRGFDKKTCYMSTKSYYLAMICLKTNKFKECKRNLEISLNEDRSNYQSLLGYVDLYFQDNNKHLGITEEQAETFLATSLSLNQEARSLYLMGKFYKDKKKNFTKAHKYLFNALTKELTESPISIDVLPITLDV